MKGQAPLNHYLCGKKQSNYSVIQQEGGWGQIVIKKV